MSGVEHYQIITHREAGGQSRLVLLGDIDLAACHDLQDAIAAVLPVANPRQFVVDAADVTFIDCASVDVLVAGHEQAAKAGSELRIANPSGIVRLILDLTGTKTLLLASCGQSQLLTDIDGPAFVLRAVRQTASDPYVPSANRDHACRPVTDFLIEDATRAMIDLQGRTAEETVGRRLLDSYPSVLSTGVFDAYVHALETATPYQPGAQNYHEPVGGVLVRGSIDLHATVVDPDRLVVSWHNDPDPQSS